MSLLLCILWLHSGGVAKQGITGTVGTKDWARNRRDYLRETEDILSYEPFLGVADPPTDHTITGRSQSGGHQYHAPEVEGGGGGGGGSGTDPMFAGPIKNVTVNVGREAVLECQVNNLRGYKVGWLKAGDQTILALHKRVITHNSRVSVSHEDNRIWKLHLRQVQESDRGCYMCQINTEQMKQQNGCLDVNVPPDIDYLKTSKDVVVQEGENVTLVCKASGHPKPRITWRREDGENIIRNPSRGKKGEKKFEGENLTIARVTRAQMGAYLCIASNDVPPTVSKRISLNVNFAPEILVPNQLLGYQFGAKVVAECLVEAYPNTINYWMKHKTEMLLNNDKYTVVEEMTSDYSTRMQLQIKDFQAEDVGVYTCISTNSLGKSDGTIRFYEIPPVERITEATHANNANKVIHSTTEQIEIKFIGNHDEDDASRHNKDRWGQEERGGGGKRSRNREQHSSRDSSRDPHNNLDQSNSRRTFQGPSFSSSAVIQDSMSTMFSILISLLAVLLQ